MAAFFYGGFMAEPKERVYEISDFDLEVAKGNILAHSVFNKFGHNESVGTMLQDLWSLGGTYVFPDVAKIMTVSSESVDDTLAGVGAQTVHIEGLDAEYNQVTEILELAGQSPVSTAHSYLRFSSMRVLTAGASEANTGAVYYGEGVVTAGKPAIVYGLIDLGNNHNLCGHYTVPASQTLYLKNINIFSGSVQPVEVRILVREVGSVFENRWDSHFAGNLNQTYSPPLIFPEKTDLRTVTAVSAGMAELSVSYSGILID